MEVISMKKCKWAGDVNDEYCKGCDGITMQVDGNSISCKECAGYEEGDETTAEKTEEPMPKPIPDKIEEDLPFDKIEEDLPFSDVENVTNDVEETTQISTKDKKTNNNTPKKEKGENEAKNKANNNPVIVADESKETEVTTTIDGEIKVTALRYTSGATVKKGDNYFKFISEEEWDVSRIEDVQEAREKLWAKLNAEVDSQIEELNNMN